MPKAPVKVPTKTTTKPVTKTLPGKMSVKVSEKNVSKVKISSKTKEEHLSLDKEPTTKVFKADELMGG
jgi:hypothetical protein